MRSRIVPLILIICLLFVPVGAPDVVPINLYQAALSDQVCSAAQTDEDHDPITITANADFESQGWPGDGTDTNPYLISRLSISSQLNCIRISGTTVHFVIEECFFYGLVNNTENGVFLSDLENGIVRNNTLSGCDITLHHCSDTQVTQNIINQAVSHGIKSENSAECIFTANMITQCSKGIEISDGENLSLAYNYIGAVSNYGIEILSGSNNVLYGNLIEANDLAIDNGYLNQWDNNQSIGNGWGYSYSDEVSIEGTANSTDHYPLEVRRSEYWGPGRLPAISQIPIPYGTLPDQSKLGWIVWSYPGQITIYRNGTVIEIRELERCGVVHPEPEILPDAEYIYDFDIQSDWQGSFRYNVHVLDGKFVTFPNAPENLKLNTTGNLADLSWIAPQFDGGMPILEYIVYRGTRPEEMTPIAAFGAPGHFLDDISSMGPFVFYAISAANAFGEGEISDYVCNLESHDGIVIDGNSDFIGAGWTGDGTESNPYSISDFAFKTTSTAINISNVDAFFVIETCYITDDDSYIGQSQGIELTNVENGIIRSSVFANKENGIRIKNSSKCLISNCTAYNNNCGILVISSENCTIIDSQLEACYYEGLYATGSKFIDLENCILTRSSEASYYVKGAYLGLSENCTFTNCTFDDLYYAVVLEICRNITMIRGWFYNCRFALDVYSSAGVSVNDTEISFPSHYTSGIRLQESTLCEFSDMTLRNSSINVNGYNKTHWNHTFLNVSIDGRQFGYFFQSENSSVDVSIYSQCLLAFCNEVNLTGYIPGEIDYGILIVNSSAMEIRNLSSSDLDIAYSTSIVVQSLSSSWFNIAYSTSIMVEDLSTEYLYIDNSIDCVLSNLVVKTRLAMDDCKDSVFDQFNISTGFYWSYVDWSSPILTHCTNITLKNGYLWGELVNLEAIQSSNCEFVGVRIDSPMSLSECNESAFYNCIFSNNDGSNLCLLDSTNITIESCVMVGGGLEIIGSERYQWNHRIVNTTLNNQQILYFADMSNFEVRNSFDIGQMIFVGCSQVTLGNDHFSNTSYGLQFAYCWDFIIDDIGISNYQYNNTFGAPQIFECEHFVISRLDFQDHCVNFQIRLCTDITVETSGFSNGGGIGVDGDSYNCTIIDCDFNHSNGITISGCSEIRIIGNLFGWGNTGIRMYYGTSSQITNNSLLGNYGIAFYSQRDSIVSYNSITSSGTEGLYLRYSGNNQYIGNRIFESQGSGILIRNEQGSSFFNNEIRSNSKYGIEIESGSNNQLYGNLFAGNSEGDAIDDGGSNTWDNVIGNCWGLSSTLSMRPIEGSANSSDNCPLVAYDNELNSPVIAHRYDVSAAFRDRDARIIWYVWGAPGRSTVLIDGDVIRDGACMGCHSIRIYVPDYGNANYTLKVVDAEGNVETSTILETRYDYSYFIPSPTDGDGIAGLIPGIIITAACSSVIAATLMDWKKRGRMRVEEYVTVEEDKEEVQQAFDELKESI